MSVHLPILPDPTNGIFTDENGVSWRREGYCCMCGSCCVGNPETGEPEGMCPKYVDNGDGTGLCSARNTDYKYWQNACRLWPQHPQTVQGHDKCTYTFTKVE